MRWYKNTIVFNVLMRYSHCRAASAQHKINANKWLFTCVTSINYPDIMLDFLNSNTRKIVLSKLRSIFLRWNEAVRLGGGWNEHSAQVYGIYNFEWDTAAWSTNRESISKQIVTFLGCLLLMWNNSASVICRMHNQWKLRNVGTKQPRTHKKGWQPKDK